MYINKAAPQGVEGDAAEDEDSPTYVEKMTSALRELDAALDVIENAQAPLDNPSPPSGEDDA
jgi:hypothetical protein